MQLFGHYYPAHLIIIIKEFCLTANLKENFLLSAGRGIFTALCLWSWVLTAAAAGEAAEKEMRNDDERKWDVVVEEEKDIIPENGKT